MHAKHIFDCLSDLRRHCSRVVKRGLHFVVSSPASCCFRVALVSFVALSPFRQQWCKLVVSVQSKVASHRTISVCSRQQRGPHCRLRFRLTGRLASHPAAFSQISGQTGCDARSATAMPCDARRRMGPTVGIALVSGSDHSCLSIQARSPTPPLTLLPSYTSRSSTPCPVTSIERQEVEKRRIEEGEGSNDEKGRSR